MNGLHLAGIALMILGSLFILTALGLTSILALLGGGFLSVIGLFSLIPGLFFLGIGFYLYQMGSKKE